MPRKNPRTQLDSPRKNRLVGAWEVHKNIRRVCRDHKIPYETGRGIIRKYRETGSTTNKQRSGRPPIFSAPEKVQIVEMAVENCRKPFRDIGNEITPSASESTVSRIVGEAGYGRRVARKVPFLTQKQKDRRLAWALDHRSMTDPDWHKIGWSDEAYVCLDDKKGTVWVTRRPGEEFLDECCVASVPQSSVRAMVWGIVAKGVKGPLIVLEYPGGRSGGMNADRYIEQVLEGAVEPFMRKMGRHRPGFQFQQDGASAHRAVKTRKWLDEHCMPIFPHPASSPDVSPIEPVWKLLKKYVRAHRPRPATYEQLCSVILDAWSKISTDEIDRYITRMPRVVEAVISANGGHTRY